MYAPGIKHRGAQLSWSRCNFRHFRGLGPSFYFDFQTSSILILSDNIHREIIEDSMIHRKIIDSFIKIGEMAILLQRNDAVSLNGSVST